VVFLSKRENNIIEIRDLKDMLLKTREIYKDNIAYKIKIENGKYIEFTHLEVREMIDALRNSTN